MFCWFYRAAILQELFFNKKRFFLKSSTLKIISQKLYVLLSNDTVMSQTTNRKKDNEKPDSRKQS